MTRPLVGMPGLLGHRGPEDAPTCARCGKAFDHGCNTGVCSEACEQASKRCGWCGELMPDETSYDSDAAYGGEEFYCGRECFLAANGITTTQEQRGER